jgi:hypothetical protein
MESKQGLKAAKDAEFHGIEGTPIKPPHKLDCKQWRFQEKDAKEKKKRDRDKKKKETETSR